MTCAGLGLALTGWAMVLTAVVFVALRRVMCNRLGGTTGDTAGALLELLELTVLLGLVVIR